MPLIVGMKKEDLVRSVAYALDGYGLRHFLNLRTGIITTFVRTDLHLNNKYDPIPELFYGLNFKEIRPFTSQDSFKVMEMFIDQVEDTEAINQLQFAISGKKPFERFRLALEKFPGFTDAWYAFKAHHFRAAAERWIYLREIEVDETDDSAALTTVIQEIIEERKQDLP